MSWQEYYRQRCISAEQAVKLIHPGDRVVAGHAVGEPSVLLDALVANRSCFRNVEIVHMISMGNGEYCRDGMQDHFRHNSLFLGGVAREAVAAGRADYTPSYFSEIPHLFRDGTLTVDVALLQVSPPDRHGFVSLGVSVDYGKTAAQNARLVIAQVNDRMPRTLGDAFLHVCEIDAFVEASAELVEIPPANLTQVEEEIGARCASLVEDGSTLQLGIGSLPDAVLKSMRHKHDLGIHSEMISDGVLDLIDAGVVNNKLKTLHVGKLVLTFLMGTRRLYDFVDDNPMVFMAPVDYVNNPYIIAQNRQMVAINSCIQVDLLGQVASESVGLRQISAVGGQVDFVRGANLSPGGKAIIAMTSTADSGRISKIVPVLDAGAAVTTSRNDVRYVVTEYGIADLRGRTLRERGQRLIAIAHPDFRPNLIEAWEQRFHTRYA